MDVTRFSWALSMAAVALLACSPPARSDQPVKLTTAATTAPAEYSDYEAHTGYGSYCSGCAPRFYAQADFLIWDRVGAGCDRVLVIDTNQPAGGDRVLTSDDFDFDYEPGVRILLGFVPDPCVCAGCSAFEASYFGIFDWSDTLVAQGPGNLAIPGDLGLVSNNFFGADEIRLLYDSELHSFELNCVHSCCVCWGTIDFLAGFRYLSLDENLSIIGVDLQEGISSYDVRTSNDLFGFQLGGRMRRNYACWTLELVGKGGVFYNDAEQSQVVTDSPFVGGPFVLRSPRGGDDDTVAGLGELSATLIRPLGSVWSFRFGYSALTIGGLALAPQQLDFTNTLLSGTAVDADSWIFVHGAHVGLEARW